MFSLTCNSSTSLTLMYVATKAPLIFIDCYFQVKMELVVKAGSEVIITRQFSREQGCQLLPSSHFKLALSMEHFTYVRTNLLVISCPVTKCNIYMKVVRD